MIYAGLASLSEGCPPDRGRLHTCYSPVRRSPARKASFPPAAPRLACVKPAASVHPEPGSNSPLSVSCFLFFLQNTFRFARFVGTSRPTAFVLTSGTFFQVGIDTETFLIELSLYLSQPDTLCRCPAACLVAKCHCSFALRDSVSARFSHPCCRVVFPERGCKVIAKSGAVQIFLRLFLKQ